ncbi:MAG: prepilin-type N-terminal cleavage/methylation domain-containing protein [Planctomycetes bacterium]|nr:prepilin-type N-terminal cleavage/methylation domain-containing protein [Planctomycetota bacterium]
MKARNGFTLVEILIVVVILGILAAIVIPQFTEASNEARTSSLVSDLQTVRSQIELFKIQHTDALPGAASGITVAEALTLYTNTNGTKATTQAPGAEIFGPYLQKIPTNPYADSVAAGGDPDGIEATAAAATVDGSTGWHFHTTTGAFHANTVGHDSL